MYFELILDPAKGLQKKITRLLRELRHYCYVGNKAEQKMKTNYSDFIETEINFSAYTNKRMKMTA